MNYDLVIFDWDGTVMDSTGRIVSCMQLAAVDLGLPSLPDEAVRGIIGLGLPEAIGTLYPVLDAGGIESMRERYAFHFIAAETTPSALYPGAESLLTGLREAGQGVAAGVGQYRVGPLLPCVPVCRRKSLQAAPGHGVGVA